MPSAAAPIASGPTSGAKVAAVPVVPHSTEVTRTARTPTRGPRSSRLPAGAMLAPPVLVGALTSLSTWCRSPWRTRVPHSPRRSYTRPMTSAHPSPSPPRRYVMTFVCEDRPGIVHAITGAIVEAGGNIVESRQFESGDSHRFYMRVEILTDASLDEVRAALAAPIESFGIEAEIDEVGRPVRTLVLTSKSTHCLNDLLFQTSIGNLPIEVPLVIANHDTPARYAEF